VSNPRQEISRIVLLSTLLVSLTPFYAGAQEKGAIVPDILAATDAKVVYRLDLLTDKLVPMSRSDLKVGCIYYHFSSRRNGWAWSFYQKDGAFWYAFGEGTTQIARCFDIRGTSKEIQKRLDEFPELAKQVDQYNHSVCLKLQADGRWKIVGTGLLQSIFNAETGERWQKFASDDYIAIIHTGGATWTVHNGVYYPGGSFSDEQ
jgi:hypothetical protein